MREFAVFFAGVLVSVAASLAQNPGSSDPLQLPAIPSGTWEATSTCGQVQANSTGSNNFKPELSGHVTAPQSMAAGCRGRIDFDCNHHDLLYVYTERSALCAFFDHERHVIH